MTKTDARLRPEDGVALIVVLLLTSVVTALTMALTTSGQTHVTISRNHQLAAQARTTAEAGLNHGVEVISAYLRQWQPNGFANMGAAMSALLRGPDNLAGTIATDADNGSLEALGIPRPPARIDFVPADGTSYEVRVFDEDDPNRGTTLSAADITRISENGTTPTVDGNMRIVVRAIGYSRSNTRVMLEALVSPVNLPAIVTNGDLRISGNPQVTGTLGSVHANRNLTNTGNGAANPDISQNATASGVYSPGTWTVGEEQGGSRPLITIPPIRAIDYKPLADFVLKANGTMVQGPQGLIPNAAVCPPADCKLIYGWEPDGAGRWKMATDVAANGTYYVEGTATVSGNPGDPALPVALTIIAEGAIEISGNPDIRPEAPELLFVTDGDLKIGGNLALPLNVEGQILVHAQLDISGNPNLAGQIIVENFPNVPGSIVDKPEGVNISGNPNITYNGLVGGGNTMAVTGWREVR